MDLFNLLIENEHFIHNIIYTSFKDYLKSKGISEQTLYFEEVDTNDPVYMNTYGIIRDFIDYNFKIWSQRYSAGVKKQSTYIQEYLISVYFLDCLPF